MAGKPLRILLLSDWYEPGFKAGGPIRSVVNFAGHMKEIFEIFVFTSDRDLGDRQTYPGIKADTWLENKGIKIYYASPASLNRKNLLAQVNQVNPEWIYLNSMFSPDFTILPLWLARQGKLKAKLVLAPRGMLKSSALAHKGFKKKLFINFLRLTGIPGKIRFHATDTSEEADIRHWFGNRSDITLLPNFPGTQPAYVPPPEKKPGILQIIFVGRIHPIKNLLFLLEALKKTKSVVFLTIVATVEDEDYWQECRAELENLPDQVHFTFLKDLPHSEVARRVQEHHLFTLPTRGENFGHAIFEALSCGRPVLISDQTPWRNLVQKQAGWDLPITDPALFTGILDEIASMNQSEFEPWCSGAWNYSDSFIQHSQLREQYQNLFQ